MNELRPLTSRFLKLPLPQHAPTIAPRAPEHPRQTDAGARFGRPSPLSISVLHGSDVRDRMLFLLFLTCIELDRDGYIRFTALMYRDEAAHRI